ARNDLGAAVVPIQPRLRNQHPNLLLRHSSLCPLWHFSVNSVLSLFCDQMIYRLIPSFSTFTLKLINRPNRRARKTQVGENDSLVNSSEALDRFELDHNSVLDQQINSISAFELHVLVDDWDGLLPFHIQIT